LATEVKGLGAGGDCGKATARACSRTPFTSLLSFACP